MARPSKPVTKPPVATECPRCGRIVLDGLDDGIPYRVDPLPVTIGAEAKARACGRYSYSLDGTPRLRDLHRVTRDQNRLPVLLDHDCSELNPETVDTRFVNQVREVAANAVPADTDHESLLLLRQVLGVRVYADEPPF